MGMTWRQRVLVWIYQLQAPALALAVLLPLLGLLGLIAYQRSSSVVGETAMSGTVIRAIVSETEIGSHLTNAVVRLRTAQRF
jgi:hypothetical protein